MLKCFLVAMLLLFLFGSASAQTCSDSLQNGDEQGIDCGGSCEFGCPTNWNSGISVLFQGTPGVDYVEEHFWHDKIIDDHKVVYIKAATPITMEHNERNMRLTARPNPRFIYDIGVNGEDNIANSGDEGIIRYTFGTEGGAYWARKCEWSGTDGSDNGRCTRYTAPFSFSQLSLPGNLDQFGDEWHQLEFADDDEWIQNVVANPGTEHQASDGKTILFVVNPKTPAIMFEKLSAEAEYYTTPPKNYWLPKIYPQTTYLTDNVQIRLVNIMTSGPVSYRIDGGQTQQYSSPINSGSFGNGTHTLEYWYNASYHKTRTIVKNPGYPSDLDSFQGNPDYKHGYLLWGSDAEFLGIKERIKSTSQEREIYRTVYNTIKSNNDGSFAQNELWKGERKGSEKALQNAFVAKIEGIDSAEEYAYTAKRMILDSQRKIDPLGYGDCVNRPNPSLEINYRGYYDMDVVFSNAFAYDLLAKDYRSSRFGGKYSRGITPIEDLKIRDDLARLPLEALVQLAGHGCALSYASGMWGSAKEMAGLIIAMAMPGYDTPYYGTSGFDGRTATHAWTPYPNHPLTWKQALWEEGNTKYGFPDFARDKWVQNATCKNPSTSAVFSPSIITKSDCLRYNNNGEYGVVQPGSYGEKIGYFDYTLMGHSLYYTANVVKTTLGQTIPFWETAFDSANKGTLNGTKIIGGTPEATQESLLTFQGPQLPLVNERFPNLAQDAYNYMKSFPDGQNNSLENQMMARRVYGLIFFHDNWETISTGNPTARFEADPLGGPPALAVSFDASESSDSDGQITQYNWGFGDGTTGTGKTTTHIYASEGRYPATLTVTDNDGKNGTATKNIIVDKDISPALVLYLGFEGNAKDYSPYFFEGSWVPLYAESYTEGKIGQAADFNGNRYINLGKHSEQEGMQQLTLTAWVRPTQLINYHNILSKGNSAYRLRLTSNGSVWYLLNNSAGSSTGGKTTQAITPLNQWSHIALTYNGSQIKVYLNAQEKHSFNWSGTINSPNTNLYIGTYGALENQPQGENFIGQIDEVRIYNKALTQAEIQALYKKTGATECVDNTKLLDYISQWKQGSISMATLMQKIAAWKAGTGCSG